jgi:hypothetical protein
MADESWRVGDFARAVGLRPHYPPCDHPDNPCSCGAAEDRPGIATALTEQWLEHEAVLTKIREIHTPWGIYTECGHQHTEAELEDEASPVKEVDLVGLVCADGLMYRVCRSCCVEPGWSEGFQTETCATKHLHTPEGPVCPTTAALDGVEMPGEPWT